MSLKIIKAVSFNIIPLMLVNTTFVLSKSLIYCRTFGSDPFAHFEHYIAMEEAGAN